MSIEEKIKDAEISTWLYDNLTPEERISAAITCEIASYLQKYRKSHGLTQESMAEILNISLDKLIHWEDGDEDFTIENIIKIALSLNLHLNSFISAIDAILT